MVQRYVEELPYEYRAMVRSKATMIEAMDGACRIKKDVEVCEGTIGKGGEKSKSYGPSEFLKKNHSQHKEKGDKAVFRSVVTCRRCCKSGHKHIYCKGLDLVCYNFGKVGDINRMCPNAKFKMDTGGKKTDAPMVQA